MAGKTIDIWLRKLVIWFAVCLLFTGLGYFWAYKALGFEIYSPQPAGWVANDQIKAAMQRMGPRYDYIIKDRILYVNCGDGEWLRLRY